MGRRVDWKLTTVDLQLCRGMVRYAYNILSWTHDLIYFIVLNMHELAVTSGFSAAYRLGADYPFKGDEECERLFRLYLALSHGARMVSLVSSYPKANVSAESKTEKG